SNSFTVTAAAADHLAFVQQPTNTAAGATITAVTVQVLDQFNNLTASTANVSVAAVGPGAFTAASTTTAAAGPRRPTPHNPPHLRPDCARRARPHLRHLRGQRRGRGPLALPAAAHQHDGGRRHHPGRHGSDR